MSTFGLGLILNFTDNASSGMNNAIRNFQNLNGIINQISREMQNTPAGMMIIGQGMVQMGDSMTNAGKSILGVFGAMGSKVIETGQTFANFRATLSALYGETGAEAKIKEIQDYAAKSVFEVESLMQNVTLMKSVGIEAMDEITTSSGKTTQKLMDYASDLAAMMPQMTNAYGTGVEAAMGAFKEYIAEGNAMSLQRGAGLDITSILGEEKGSTVEERTQQVADLIEQMNIAGYTAQLFGTPMQQLSNINDAVTNSLLAISDAGVFDTFSQLVGDAAGFINELVGNEERMNVITGVLGDTISTLMKPLQMLLDFVKQNVDVFVDWMAANPKLAKSIMLVVAGFGAFLVAGGAILKVSGYLLMLVASLKMLGGVSGVFTLLKAGAMSFMRSVLPLILIATALYTAWQMNLFGIRDLVGGVFSQIGTVLRLVFDALADGEMSMENYNLAESLGLLPFINHLLDAKHHLELFVEGFKQGVQDISNFWTNLMNSVNTDSWLYGMLSSIGNFFQQFASYGDEADQSWVSLGNTIAHVVAVALGIAAVIQVVSGVVMLITRIISGVTGIISAVRNVASAVSTVISFLMANPIVALIAVIVAAVVALAIVIITHWDQIKAALGTAAAWVMANIITPIVNFFTTLGSAIMAIVSAIVSFFQTAWSTAVSVVMSIVQAIVSFFQNLGSTISSIVSSIVNFFVSGFNSVVSFVSGVVNSIVSFFTSMGARIKSVVTGAINAVKGVFSSAAGAVKAAWGGVSAIFDGIKNAIGRVKDALGGVGSKIKGFFGGTPAAAHGVENFAGGLIQVNEQGGELINLPSGSTVIPHDQSVTDSLKKGIEIGAQSMGLYGANVAPVAPVTPSVASSSGDNYSVTFAAGSVVIQLANASDAELEKAADKLLKIISRKTELKSMAKRNTKRAPSYA